MVLIFLGFDEISWSIRNAFETCESYDCAFNYMHDHPVIAPGYVVMGGLKGNEGAIISRDRWAPAHVDLLSEDRWYLTQTNSDHWKKICLDRCSTACKNMDAIGETNISLDTMREDVLFIHPNFNEITLYNSKMSASLGVF
jgi:hypothetical protein